MQRAGGERRREPAGHLLIDVKLAGGDTDAASAMLQAVGIDANAAQQVLSGGLGTEFSLAPAAAHGVCWIDDNDGHPAVQVYFAWNEMRLVTVRSDGDAAIAQVRQRVSERVDVIKQHPSTLFGVVLQLMLASVQRGLTQTMIDVGTLDMEIIATATPKSDQTQRLNEFRTAFQPLALRFPMYVVNVRAALIDPGPVTGMDDAGMSQLQQLLSAVQGTSGLIDTLASGIRNAAQDIQGQVGSWQSDRINVLTIVTMVFLPISFLTGYFGMNFTWFDNQLDSFWSWLLFGVVLPIGLVLISVTALATGGYTMPRLFRRRRRPVPPAPH
ncbi:MAG: hypothetical protein IPO93_17855 [Actinobacteria bacterium]|nr:hypothetical protein [Actinomycetota bacterium]